MGASVQSSNDAARLRRPRASVNAEAAVAAVNRDRPCSTIYLVRHLRGRLGRRPVISLGTRRKSALPVTGPKGWCGKRPPEYVAKLKDELQQWEAIEPRARSIFFPRSPPRLRNGPPALRRTISRSRRSTSCGS